MDSGRKTLKRDMLFNVSCEEQRQEKGNAHSDACRVGRKSINFLTIGGPSRTRTCDLLVRRVSERHNREQPRTAAPLFSASFRISGQHRTTAGRYPLSANCQSTVAAVVSLDRFLKDGELVTQDDDLQLFEVGRPEERPPSCGAG